MKVSIIIPVYMVSDYIEECLLSALNQTYNDLEIICVNDATRDDSFIKAVHLIEGHKRKDIVKTAVHEKNQGLSAARNTGIKISTGDYLYFLDSDDTLPLDAIETLAGQIKDERTDCVIGDYDRSVSEADKDGRNGQAKGKVILENEDIANSLFRHELDIMACNKLISRKVFFDHNNWFYTGLLHEDILWTFNLALIIRKVVITPAVTYHYRIREDSITQKKSERNFKSLVFINSKIDERAKGLDLGKYVHFADFSLNLKVYILKELVRSNFDMKYYNQVRKSISNTTSTGIYLKNSTIKNLLILLLVKSPGLLSKLLTTLLVKVNP